MWAPAQAGWERASVRVRAPASVEVRALSFRGPEARETVRPEYVVVQLGRGWRPPTRKTLPEWPRRYEGRMRTLHGR